MNKVLIIGCSGTGKSIVSKFIVSKRLSRQTGLPYTPTDPFYWEGNWKLATTQKVIESVDAVTQQNTWILDGNFDAQREFVWQRADVIIWLDYPLWQVAAQITKRNLGLWLSQNVTWSGNRMTWKRAWSGIRHSLKSYRLKRQNYPIYLKDVSHLQIYHFHSSGETTAWIKSLDSLSN